jgi:hypothetical protein
MTAAFKRMYNVTVYGHLDVANTVTGEVSAVTEMRRLQQNINEWIIIVDLDEFVEFPDPIPTILSRADAEGANVVRGIMWDRFTAHGGGAEVTPESDVRVVFPVRARLVKNVMRGMDFKGVLIKGHLKSCCAHHMFEEEIVYYRELEISHYTWTKGSIDRLHRAHQMVVDSGAGFAVEYMRVFITLFMDDFSGKSSVANC